MALWNGSAINSNETAKVFNQLNNLKSIPIIRKKNGLLYKFLGKIEPNSVKTGMTAFERSDKITGKNVEVGLLGSLPSTTKVADGSEELGSVTLSYDANAFGAAEFPLTHYTLPLGIPASELDRFKGKEAKTANYLDDQMARLMLGYENDMGTDLHANTGSTIIGRKILGSWLYAVSTGGGTGGADATGETGNGFRLYGTIDRQDAANADYRGIVNAATGSLSLATLRTYANLADANGGTTDTIVSGTTLYTKEQQLVEAYTIVTNAPEMVDFGGKYFIYDGMTFLHDQRCPSGIVGGLDSSTWLHVDNDDALTSTGVVKDFTRYAAYVVPTQRWVQVICKKPNSNFKLLAVT